MNPLDVFLRDHASVHTKAAVPAPHNVDWLFDGLSDEHMRATPHGMNAIAWLLWHMARVEDSCVAWVVCGQPALLDDAWVARLGVDQRPSDGEGMSKADVAILAATIDLTALRAYRDAVGRRTRELVSALWPDDWHTPLTEADLQTATTDGGVASMPWLVGTQRDALLGWWAIQHSHYHLGQAAMLKGLIQQER